MQKPHRGVSDRRILLKIEHHEPCPITAVTDRTTVLFAAHASNDPPRIQNGSSATMPAKTAYAIVAQNTFLSSPSKKDATQPKAQPMRKEVGKFANVWHVSFSLCSLPWQILPRQIQ
jgi:DMSO/TMAO reductase YedYZ heme-binding membrane subunit